jgi:hypothetical protein
LPLGTIAAIGIEIEQKSATVKIPAVKIVPSVSLGFAMRAVKM